LIPMKNKRKYTKVKPIMVGGIFGKFDN